MIWTRRFSISVPYIGHGHSPLGDITNTYDSQKQCNPLGSNILGPILCDGIKCVVVARAEEIKKVHEVPFLGADGYKSALKYVYEYIRCYENLQEIKTEETFYENLG